jgi:hypothetical protein
MILARRAGAPTGPLGLRPVDLERGNANSGAQSREPKDGVCDGNAIQSLGRTCRPAKYSEQNDVLVSGNRNHACDNRRRGIYSGYNRRKRQALQIFP